MDSDNKVKPSPLRGATIRLRDRALALEPAIAWEILGELVERYPEYIMSDSDAEKNKFKVLYRNTAGEEQGFALLSTNEIAMASREPLSAAEWQERYNFFIDRVLAKLAISPLALDHLDNRSVPSWKTRVHHSRILFALLGNSTGLGEMFADMEVYQFSPQSIFFVDREKYIVCGLSFQSRGAGDSDRLEVYPEPYELIVQCGVAKTGAFGPKTALAEVVGHVLTLSEQLFDSKFIPAVVDPISRLISQLERELPADAESGE